MAIQLPTLLSSQQVAASIPQPTQELLVDAQLAENTLYSTIAQADITTLVLTLVIGLLIALSLSVYKRRTQLKTVDYKIDQYHESLFAKDFCSKEAVDVSTSL